MVDSARGWTSGKGPIPNPSMVPKSLYDPSPTRSGMSTIAASAIARKLLKSSPRRTAGPSAAHLPCRP